MLVPSRALGKDFCGLDMKRKPGRPNFLRKGSKGKVSLKNGKFELKNWKDSQHTLMLLRTENMNDKQVKIHIELKEFLNMIVRANYSITFNLSLIETDLYAKELHKFKEGSLEETINAIVKLNQNIRDLYRQDLAECLQFGFTKLRLECDPDFVTAKTV
ncbi:10125_t:CDS:2 [Gigaspora rosea]|nr:10125_t:CDS:2 [Gigaspora rosea]